MKRPPQERASNGKAEHSKGRIEACSSKIATSRTGDLVRRKEDQEMDKMEVDRTVVRYSARLMSKKTRTQSLREPSRTSHEKAATSL